MTEFSSGPVRSEHSKLRVSQFVRTLGKVASKILSRSAKSSEERELLRREALGPYGRIIEDARLITHMADDLHGLIKDKTGLNEISKAQYRRITRYVAGEKSANPFALISIAQRKNLPLSIFKSVVQAVTHNPQLVEKTNAYRYVSLTTPTTHGPQTEALFMVGIHERKHKSPKPVVAIPLDMLPLEEAAGNLKEDIVSNLGTVVAHDLEEAYHTALSYQKIPTTSKLPYGK